MLRINYLTYVAWSLLVCACWRPQWIYASDPMAVLPALLARSLFGIRVVYHEHDSPTGYAEPNRSQRLLQRARQRLAHNAELCVLPQEQRLKVFIAETGRRAPTVCVWNCPQLAELRPSKERQVPGEAQEFRFYFHGSINKSRLPATILEALARLPQQVTLTIVGYETVGSNGYVQELLNLAAKLGLGDRFRFVGTVANRADVLDIAGACDVGLAFMPLKSDDINMRHMAGASNKPFDYLASGLMLLVSDLADWRKMFVETGCARACDPTNVDSLTSVMSWCVNHPHHVRAMGIAGQERVRSEWNYNWQFSDVLAIVNA